MTSQAQKLIENLKKEIKNYDWKKAEQIFDETSLMFDTIETQREFFKFIEIKEKQAQLQFAEKLIEALKKDLIKKQPCPNKYPLISACYEQVIDDIKVIIEKISKKKK